MITIPEITSLGVFLGVPNLALPGFWNYIVAIIWIAFFARGNANLYGKTEESIAFASLVAFIAAFLLTLVNNTPPLVNPLAMAVPGVLLAIYGGFGLSGNR